MKVSKKNVLKAYADGCDDVKKVIKNLFPDAFTECEPPLYYKFLKEAIGNIGNQDNGVAIEEGSRCAPTHLSFNGKSLYLSGPDGYHWELIPAIDGFKQDKLLVLKRDEQ